MESNHSLLAKEWLSRASDTLRFTEAGFTDTKIAHDACYGSQQAAEKALKAVLVAHGQEPPRTHDTADLLAVAQQSEPTLATLAPEARLLVRYVVDARYPTELQTDFTEAEAQEAIQAAKKIVEDVTKLLQ